MQQALGKCFTKLSQHCDQFAQNGQLCRKSVVATAVYADVLDGLVVARNPHGDVIAGVYECDALAMFFIVKLPVEVPS